MAALKTYRPTWPAPTRQAWARAGVALVSVVVTASIAIPSAAAFSTAGAIGAEYAALGGANSVIGAPITGEFDALGGGRGQHFTAGSIYWSPSTGASEVHGAIRGTWAGLGWERGPAGYPLSSENRTPDQIGAYNLFQGASIYWSPASGAQQIQGAIRTVWSSLGWEGGFLGYPVTSETSAPDRVGRYNAFQGGSIYWSPASGAHEVHGAIRESWAAMGYERSSLGYPVTSESTAPDQVGRYNVFQGGAVYWSPGTGAHFIRGAIWQKWASMGWEGGQLGYPTSNEYAVAGGSQSDFQHGSLTWSQATGAVTVRLNGPGSGAPGALSGLPWNSGTLAGDPMQAAEWTAYRGRSVDYALDYLPRESWGMYDDPSGFFGKYAGWPGHVSISMALFPEDGSSYGPLIAGAYDQHFANFGRAMVAAGRATDPIRLGWEADGDWFAWGIRGGHAGSSVDFKNGFRRAVAAIRQGNPQAVIDLTLEPVAYQDMWPGDGYVDIVGTDYYDMWALRGDFASVANGPAGINTAIAFARSHGKRFSVGEWGVVSQAPYGGGDDPAFVQGMWNVFSANADLLAYEAYFSNADDGNVRSSLYNPNQNPASSALYRELW
jgi:LGFP repeat/Glycosyl hydrolase family 26